MPVHERSAAIPGGRNHSLVAQYAGDSSYGKSTSATDTLTVTPHHRISISSGHFNLSSARLSDQRHSKYERARGKTPTGFREMVTRFESYERTYSDRQLVSEYRPIAKLRHLSSEMHVPRNSRAAQTSSPRFSAIRIRRRSRSSSTKRHRDLRPVDPPASAPTLTTSGSVLGVPDPIDNRPSRLSSDHFLRMRTQPS